MTGQRLSASPATSQPEDGEPILRDLLLAAHGASGPYASYKKLRDSSPVYVSGTGVVVLTRYSDCDHGLRDRHLGKVDESLGFRLSPIPIELQRRAMHRFRRTMLFQNPPNHERLRRLVADVFTARHIKHLRQSIASTTDRLLDVIEDKRDADIIADLALPLPVSVIADLLGLPPDGRDVAAPWVRDLVAPLEPAASAEAIERAASAEDKLAQYLDAVITEKRRRPGDDLLSRLATAEGSEALDHDECIGTAILLFAAGFETTTNLIGNGTYALLSHPEQADLLRARPELAANAVEELLRFDAPVQTNGRTAIAPTRIADTAIEPGQIVLMLLGSANRDPSRFDAPDTLDITRAGIVPLSFGAGIHYCLGAPLARMEGAEVFPRLLKRFPRLAIGDQVQWRPGLTFRGLISLGVETR